MGEVVDLSLYRVKKTLTENRELFASLGMGLEYVPDHSWKQWGCSSSGKDTGLSSRRPGFNPPTARHQKEIEMRVEIDVRSSVGSIPANPDVEIVSESVANYIESLDRIPVELPDGTKVEVKLKAIRKPI